jgi:hypothetical protein
VRAGGSQKENEWLRPTKLRADGGASAVCAVGVTVCGDVRVLAGACAVCVLCVCGGCGRWVGAMAGFVWYRVVRG